MVHYEVFCLLVFIHLLGVMLQLIWWYFVALIIVSQGEAQGTLNGIKALTEGFGPLLFGGLMALFEGGSLPSGSPYLLAAIGALWALLHSFELPDHPETMGALKFPSLNYILPSKENKALLDDTSDDEDDSTYEMSESVRL